MDIQWSFYIVGAVLFKFRNIDALVCYACARTSGTANTSANIECLADGYELFCGPDEDRCYSTSYTSPSQDLVSKGCTTSESCVGRTACCEDDLCNADPVNSLAGYGSPCRDIAGCIQGNDVMRCELEQPGDRTKVCLCNTVSYRLGATCKKKSYPDGACTNIYECLNMDTTCQQGRCRCPMKMFGNGTECYYQKDLGQNCTLHRECYGANTQCNGQCTCKFGYLKEARENQTYVCSGAERLRRDGPNFQTNVLYIMSIPWFVLFMNHI